MILGSFSGSGILTIDSQGNVDSISYLPIQYGGTGTTTSPSAGQILYSPSGTTYTPTTFSTLPGLVTSGVTGSRPASPTSGQLYYNTSLFQLEVYYNGNWYTVAISPSAPTIGTATDQPSGCAYNNGQASITFTPATSGGIATSYTITSSPGSYTGTGSSSPILVTGLQSSTQYTYSVTATNNYGTSSASSSTSNITATTVPQAPTIGTATGADSSVLVTFTAGATGGSTISNYKYSLDGTTYTAFSPAQNTSPLTISGLTNNNSYSVYLKAVNANGDSAASSVSNTVSAAPPAFSATVTNGSVINYGNYNYAVFTSNGTFQVTSPGNADVLVVAGGGGGGGTYRASGGGGGGGVIYQKNYNLTSGSYSVTIGSGGGTGSNGQNTTFGSLFTAIGGGYGDTGYGGNGGSGGGGNNVSGLGTSGQGNNGGNHDGSGVYGGAGGGGFNEVGHNANGNQANYFGGSGGLGIYAMGVMVGAGGGGGDRGDTSGPNPPSTGQASGGAKGNQGRGDCYQGTSLGANPNTGNGGGGGTGTNTGGSGVVIVRYAA